MLTTTKEHITMIGDLVDALYDMRGDTGNEDFAELLEDAELMISEYKATQA